MLRKCDACEEIKDGVTIARTYKINENRLEQDFFCMGCKIEDPCPAIKGCPFKMEDTPDFKSKKFDTSCLLKEHWTTVCKRYQDISGIKG